MLGGEITALNKNLSKNIARTNQYKKIQPDSSGPKRYSNKKNKNIEKGKLFK
jgi:hypothetical protein